VLIDESYNANPASMRAAIALLKDTALPDGGRRIAILGDMLEMGESAGDVHAALAAPLLNAGITDIWLAGPEMAHLRDALPDGTRVEYRLSVDELKQFALASIATGDVVMIKSSKGTGCGRIVSALLETYPASSGPDRAE
jgi:UDP-N-acetylmuramoyl-tripeptide--D-alanyl-D-alanine ligase